MADKLHGYESLMWRCGRVARQRSAKPCTRVQIPATPPNMAHVFEKALQKPVPLDIMLSMTRKRSWTTDNLKGAVETSTSYRQVIAKIGLRPTGGNYEQVKKYIKEEHLNTGHFKGKAWNAGLKGIGRPRISLDEILVKNSNFQSFKLKNRLFQVGLKPKYCELCGWAKKTPDGYLPLELDHVNGDRHDNRLGNLRILCPNCHSLQPTHRSRIRKKQKIA